VKTAGALPRPPIDAASVADQQLPGAAQRR